MVLGAGTVRFGDIEKVIGIARSVWLRGLCWLCGPMLWMTHWRRFAKLGLLRHRRPVLLIRLPRSEGLLWYVAFSGHV